MEASFSVPAAARSFPSFRFFSSLCYAKQHYLGEEHLFSAISGIKKSIRHNVGCFFAEILIFIAKYLGFRHFSVTFHVFTLISASVKPKLSQEVSM